MMPQRTLFLQRIDENRYTEADEVLPEGRTYFRYPLNSTVGIFLIGIFLIVRINVQE